MTEVTGILCPRCGDFIYSRARHDFHYCSCGGCFVDGGFDYLRWGVEPEINQSPKSETREVPATRGELFADWNRGHNTFGRILKPIEWAPGVPHPLTGCQLTLFPMEKEH